MSHIIRLVGARLNRAHLHLEKSTESTNLPQQISKFDDSDIIYAIFQYPIPKEILILLFISFSLVFIWIYLIKASRMEINDFEKKYTKKL